MGWMADPSAGGASPSEPVRVRRTPDGTLTYAVAVPPQCIPAVAPHRLLAAWAMARRAAALHRWGPPRRLLFAGDGPPAQDEAEGIGATEIAIADADAGCWAEAVDREVGLDTLAGIALCLRLLALIDILAHAPWLGGLFDVTPDGIDLHPSLLSAAAAMPLNAAARFDEGALRRILSRPLHRAADAPSPRSL